MRKIISIILTVLMILGSCPAAFAADEPVACTVTGLTEGETYYLNSGIIPKVVVTSDDAIKVEFKIDGERVAEPDTEAPFEYILPTSGSHEGTHTLGIYINDSEIASEEINYTAICAEIIEYSDDYEDGLKIEYVSGENFTSTAASGGVKPYIENETKYNTDSWGYMNGNMLMFRGNKEKLNSTQALLLPAGTLPQDYDIAIIEFDLAKEDSTQLSLRASTDDVEGTLNHTLETNTTSAWKQYSAKVKMRIQIVYDNRPETKTAALYITELNGDKRLERSRELTKDVPTNVEVSYDQPYTAKGRVMIDNLSVIAFKTAPDLTADISCEVGTTDYIITFSNKIFGEDDAVNAAKAAKVVWLNGEDEKVEDYEERVSTTYGTDLEGNDYVMLSINEEGVENLASYKIKVDGVEDIYTQPLTKEFPFSAFKVTGVTIDKPEIELMRDGATDTLSVTITPDSALNKNVTWSSSDENIASVDENGVVTSNKPGTAIITVTTEESGFTATSTVNVINPVASVISEGFRTIVDFNETTKLAAEAIWEQNVGKAAADRKAPIVTGTSALDSTTNEWVSAAESDYVRVGDYALHATGTGNAGFKINSKFTVDGSANEKDMLKMWVYNNSEDEIKLGTRLQDSAGTYFTYSTQSYGGFTLPPQSWTLIDFPICTAADNRSGQVEFLNFWLNGSYVVGGVENANSGKNIDLYFNEPQLISGSPNAFEVAETSYADGAEGVNPKLRSYRVTFTNNLNNPESAADEVVLLDSTGAEVEGVTKTYGPNYVELKVYDDAADTPKSLNAGEEYTVKVKKRVLYDEVGQTLSADQSFTFTTATEGAKFAPSVVVTSPVDLERYAIGDTNTLKAMAFDDDGTVESVKFYNGSSLIGEATNQGEGLFTYKWEDIPASTSFTDYLKITAVATDDEGNSSTSAPVNLLVFNPVAPELSVVIPESYFGSIGGGEVDKLIISGTFDDEDGYVKSIKIKINEELVTTIENPIGNFSYTSDEKFEVGEYNVEVIATDDEGNETSVTGKFNSVAGARESKPFYMVDASDSANSGLWMKSSATIEAKAVENEGLVVTTKDAGDSILTTTISNNDFKLKNTQVDVTLNFGTNTNRRKITIGGVVVAEIKSNGTITDEKGNAIGGGFKYAADTNYTFSLISNPVTGKGVCLVNGQVIKDLVTITPVREMDIEITQTLSEEGAASFTIVDYAAYYVGTAVTNATITLNKEGGTIADGAENVAVYAPTTIEVDMTDKSTDVDLTKAVTLVDNVTGKACELKMVEGKLTIASQLAHGTSYTIRLNGNLFNTKGETYAGSDTLTFTTKATSDEKKVVVDRAATGTGFNVREVSFAALGGDGATVTFTPTIAASEAKTVYVAIVVYKGNKIVNKTIEDFDIENGDRVEVSTVVPQIADDVSVQAFVLDSLTEPKSLAEDVFVIK